MTETNITIKPCCFGCDFNCEIKSNPSIKMYNCLEKQYSIWPDKNQFLKEGLISTLIKHHHNHLSYGFIFIDFSCYNIRYFTNGAWLEHLLKTGMHLILIADKRMEALATYWDRHSPYIAATLYASDDAQIISKKINNAFAGRMTHETKRKKLSATELKVLDLLICESSVKEISKILNLKEKRTYNIKKNLQGKLGGRLNNIISC